MNITICGSIAFYDEMLRAKKELEGLGHVVKLPPSQVFNNNGKPIEVKDYYALRKKSINDIGSWVWGLKADLMREHFSKIEWCDAVFVLNLDKNGIRGYIGPNTLIEMGLAFHLKKRIFLLRELPELDYKEELLGMKPFLINGDLGEIK